MKKTNNIIMIFIILLTVAVNLPADNIPSGVWDDWSKDQAVIRSGSRYVNASEADRQSILNKLTEIAELFRTTTSLNPPAGTDITLTRSISFTIPAWLKNNPGPPAADLSLAFYPLVKSRDGNYSRARRAAGFINVYVNGTAPVAVFGPGDKSLEGEEWYLEPLPIGSAGPYTVYEPIYDARSGRTGSQFFVHLVSEKLPPLWLPVTVEEFLNDRVRRVEEDLAEYKANMSRIPDPVTQIESRKKNLITSYEQAMKMYPDKAEAYKAELEKVLKDIDDSADKEIDYYKKLINAAEERNALMEKEIADMHRQIAALSKEERNAQASGSANFRVAQTKRQAVIQPPGTPGGSDVRKIVRRNTDVFATGFSADSFTMFVVSFHSPKNIYIKELFEQVTAELDWRGLSGFLD